MTDAENVDQAKSAEAAAPKRVERTRAVILNKPPVPTEEAIEERERCIAGTHSNAGPLPMEGVLTRAPKLPEPDVPPTDVEAPAES